jgi:predicted nucleotidyltransferase
MNDLNLGETEQFEVWFLPTNRKNYSAFVAQTYLSLVSAREYIEASKPNMRETMEIVRVRIVRQLMEAA